MKYDVKKPLLSICIPTYNRATYLDKCLNSLFDQINDMQDDVEIVISDNNSSDDTYNVVSSYIDKGLKIVYNKNSENIYDENFYKSLIIASGIYRKLINDTVIFKKGSISFMLDIIKNNSIYRKQIVWSNMNDDNCIIECDFKKLVLKCGYRLTSILWFGIWEDNINFITKDVVVFETKLWQFYNTLLMVDKLESAIVCNKKLFIIQEVDKKDLSYGLYRIFYVNFFKFLWPYFCKYTFSVDEVERIKRDLLFGFFMTWCLNTSSYKKDYIMSNTEDLLKNIKNEYSHKPYWLLFIIKYRIKKFKRNVKGILNEFFETGK